MKRMIYRSLVAGAFILLLGSTNVIAQQDKPPIKEVTIEVQPRIIALPGGEAGKNIAKVPIRRARMRNTELRDLNKLYNAVSVERIYEVVDPDVAAAEQALGDKLFQSKKKKKKKLEGRRIARKTSKGFYESEDGKGKISADKRIKLKKKKDALGSESRLLTEEPGVSEDDIVAMNDVYIFGFQDYKNKDGEIVSINIDDAVAAYNALEVVISAKKN